MTEEKELKKISPESVRSVTISLKRELARRAELQAIRRDMLALVQEEQKMHERFQDKMLALTKRVYDLTVD